MGYWLGITFSCLDVLCVAVFCDAFLERKTRGLRFVVGALLCGVLSYIATIFVSHISEESPITLLKFAALITVYFVFASLFYLGKFWMRLLVVLLAYAIFTLLEFCVLYSLLALLHIRYDEYVANMKFYLASAAITYSLKFLLSSGIKKIHKPMVASSANIKWAPLTIGFPLISLVGISICYYLSMNGKIAAAFVLFSSGILLATNAVILILIDLTEKNNLAQEQQKTLNEQLRSQRANIDALSSAYATQRKMTHDFRHHIAALSGMLQGGETQQAQDYLAALQEQQTERALMVNTHNSVIDAVLNQKGYAAQKQHIDIQFEVNDLSPLQIELIDCTVVLGNLLDKEGMAHFYAAYNIYNLLLVLSTAGLPLALSRLVSRAAAQGRRNAQRRIFRTALALLAVIGAVCSAVMCLFPQVLSGLLHDSLAAPAIRVLGPAVLFVCLTSAIRGYTQGLGDMMPTAVSQMTESAGKLVIGMGESKALGPFVKACDQFKYLDLILDHGEADSAPAVPAAEAGARAAAGDDTAINRESIGRIIDGMIDEMDDGTGWVRTSRVGDQLIKRYPDFDVRNFGSKSLNKFLASLPELEVEERILANGNPIQFVHMRPAPAPKKAARKTTTKRRTTRKSK